MGAPNTLLTRWTCPFCRTEQEGPINFVYGPCLLYRFPLGGRVDWSRAGPVETARLSGGTGIVMGVTACVKAGVLPPEEPLFPDRLDPAAVEELRGKRGCPQVMAVNIELADDVIERVFFDPDLKKVLRYGW